MRNEKRFLSDETDERECDTLAHQSKILRFSGDRYLGNQLFHYNANSRQIERMIENQAKPHKIWTSSLSVPVSSRNIDDVIDAYELAWLRSKQRPTPTRDRRGVRVVDLFSGCGALSLGLWEACRALEMHMVPVLAADIDKVALETYSHNFPGVETHLGSVEDFLDSDVGQAISPVEAELKRRLCRIDFLIGGPPCQGNSNLNNHTRRDDPKNALYLKMARFAEVIGPRYIIIENVPDVLHERNGVVDQTRTILERLGYHIDEGVIDMSKIGVPQRRRRFIMIASQSPISLKAILERHTCFEPHSLGWAIDDLEDTNTHPIFDHAATPAAQNRERIAYLFEHGLYELPDAERPDCHRLKPHSYPSVYGRMHWDEPSPTLTRGFGSMGQGRFVHSHKRRTITPHEAARIQYIPDFFDFGNASRTRLQEMIGNAVPPKLSYVLGVELLK